MHLARAMTPKPKVRNERHKRPSVAARQALTPMPKAHSSSQDWKQHSLVAREALTPMPKARDSYNQPKRSSVAARDALTPMPKARSSNNVHHNRSGVIAREAFTPVKAMSVRSKASMYESAWQREARASYADQPPQIARRDSKSRPPRHIVIEKRGYLPSKYSLSTQTPKRNIKSSSLLHGNIGPLYSRSDNRPGNVMPRIHPSKENSVTGSPPPPLKKPQPELGMAPLTQKNLQKFLHDGSTTVARNVCGTSAVITSKSLTTAESPRTLEQRKKNRAHFAKSQKRVLQIERKTIDHRTIEEQAFVNKFYSNYRNKKASRTLSMREQRTDGKQSALQRKTSF